MNDDRSTTRPDDTCGPNGAHADGIQPSFYWAVAEVPATRPTREALLYAIEPWLPVSLDDVEIRFAPVKGTSKWLACAIEHVRLEQLLSQRDEDDAGERESIVPDQIPEHITADLQIEPDAVLLNKFEFRSGAFASTRHRRLQRLSIAVGMITILLVAVMTSLGFQLRARALRNNTLALQSQSASIVDELLGPTRQTALDPTLRLEAAVRTLQATRTPAATVTTNGDVTDHLFLLLSAIPDQPHKSIDHIAVRRESMTVRGISRSLDEFDALQTHIDQALPEWSIRSANTQRAARGFSFSFVLEPAETPSGEGGSS